MKNLPSVLLCIAILGFCSRSSFGVGEAGGLTLLEMSGARPAALGSAFSAAQNDIHAFGFNPASLSSLKSGHASFFFKEGLDDDSFGQIQIGALSRYGSFGFSAGYYNGGSFNLIENRTSRTVRAQTDLLASLGYSFQAGKFSLGLTGKYLSSELIETARAQAFAADIGLQFAATSKLQLGAALQNFGTQLKFVNQGDDLPRTLRGGASYLVSNKSFPTTLFIDVPYQMIDQEIEPGLGIETRFGPLAIRGGLRRLSESNEVSIGSGFLLGQASLDYAFAMLNQDLGSQHQISLSMRFTGPSGNTPFVHRVPKRPLVEINPRPQKRMVKKKPIQRKGKMRWMESPKRRIYRIKKGDSLAKIAKEFYGTPKMWRDIYMANRHLVDSPKDIKEGQKIILP